MPRYAICPKRNLLICGQQVPADEPVAYLATDLPPRDVIAMVQFGNAYLIDPEAASKAESAEAESADADTDSDEPAAETAAKAATKKAPRKRATKK